MAQWMKTKMELTPECKEQFDAMKRLVVFAINQFMDTAVNQLKQPATIMCGLVSHELARLAASTHFVSAGLDPSEVDQDAFHAKITESLTPMMQFITDSVTTAYAKRNSLN